MVEGVVGRPWVRRLIDDGKSGPLVISILQIRVRHLSNTFQVDVRTVASLRRIDGREQVVHLDERIHTTLQIPPLVAPVALTFADRLTVLGNTNGISGAISATGSGVLAYRTGREEVVDVVYVIRDVVRRIAQAKSTRIALPEV